MPNQDAQLENELEEKPGMFVSVVTPRTVGFLLSIVATVDILIVLLGGTTTALISVSTVKMGIGRVAVWGFCFTPEVAARLDVEIGPSGCISIFDAGGDGRLLQLSQSPRVEVTIDGKVPEFAMIVWACLFDFMAMVFLLRSKPASATVLAAGSGAFSCAGFIASIILNRPLFTAPSLDATPGPATYLLGIAVPMHLMVALLFWRDHILMMRALQAVEDEEGRAVMASTVTQRRQRRRTNSCGSEGDEESECTLVDDDPYPAIPVRAITTPASRALR